MPILSRFRQNRHHAPTPTQPHLAAQPTEAGALTAEDWIDIQLLAHRTIPLQTFESATRLAAGLWHWRFFSDTEADRRIMARLQSRHLIEATNAEHTCAKLTTRGVTQIFHLCRHVRLTQAPVLERDKVQASATM